MKKVKIICKLFEKKNGVNKCVFFIGTKLFIDFLRKKNVPVGAKCDPLKVLCSEADVASWAGQGLPSDRGNNNFV